MIMRTIETPRFGAIEFTDDDVIFFDEGILGFPDSHRFVILCHREGSPFRWLQSLDEAWLAFLMTDPARFLADYEPEISNEDAERLGLTEETPRLLFTLVSIPPGHPEEMTLNLAGPVVINVAARRGRQLVLDDPTYSVKYRVFADSAETTEKVAA